jgi:hypothetical protein
MNSRTWIALFAAALAALTAADPPRPDADDCASATSW